MRTKFPKRQVVIEVEHEVYMDLMIQAKQDEKQVKKILEDDISFIYDHYRLAEIAKNGVPNEEETTSNV